MSAKDDGAEEGSGTLLVIGVVLVAVVAAIVMVGASVVFSHRARAEAVADLAALAAGDISATARWEDVADRPCSAARAVVDANGMTLSSCEIIGVDARVEVEDGAHVLGLPLTVRARARAGPDGDTEN